MGLNEVKIFWMAQELINHIKRQCPEQEKSLLGIHMMGGLICRIYKDFIKLNISKSTNWIKNGLRITVESFQKKKYK